MLISEMQDMAGQDNAQAQGESVDAANAANAANVDYYDEVPAKVGDETVEDDGDEDSSYEEYVWGTPEYL